MNITRRDALMGATAAAVVTGAIAAPLAIKAAGVKVAQASEPLVALETDLFEARAAQDRAWEAWQTAFEPIKDICSGWPKVDFSSPAMGKLRGWFYGERIHLDTIKRYNRHVEELVGSRPKILARRKAEGRERIRWWVGARRAQRAAEEAVGLPRLTAIDNAAMERLFAAEKEVENTPAKGMRGVLIKLREAHYQISNQHSFPAPGEVWELDVVGAVLRDFERLIGGMRP